MYEENQRFKKVNFGKSVCLNVQNEITKFIIALLLLLSMEFIRCEKKAIRQRQFYYLGNHRRGRR